MWVAKVRRIEGFMSKVQVCDRTHDTGATTIVRFLNEKMIFGEPKAYLEVGGRTRVERDLVAGQGARRSLGI